MASPLKRPGIWLNLAAFIGVGVFCIGTEAPIIQQDILRRCQDTLLMHRIPIRGLSVDGRDVVLSGVQGSAILSPRAHQAVAEVGGVRVIYTRILPGGEQASGNDGSGALGVNAPLPGVTPLDAASTQAASSPLQHDIQSKIDQILDTQGIAFNADTAVLTPESQSALDKIAAYLASTPGLQCEVRGYDKLATETHQNWVLAFQRALATEDYLETRGVPDWRLSTRAFHVGEGADGRRMDRPVDLVVRTRE